jgi:hypothetical protein
VRWQMAEVGRLETNRPCQGEGTGSLEGAGGRPARVADGRLAGIAGGELEINRQRMWASS